MTAVIIIFNTSRFLTEQIRLLQKHVTDKIAVIDNSNDFEVSVKLKEICTETQVDYTKTAVNESDFSKSHAYACEIGIEMFRRKDDSLLMLDHDIFPLRKFEEPENIILAGIPQERTSAKEIVKPTGERYKFTYLWPGLLYLNTKFLNAKSEKYPNGYPISIRPCIVMDVFLDTGGGLHSLVAGNPDNVQFYAEHHQAFILNDKEDMYSIVDNGGWMHFQRASGWDKNPNHDERIEKLMSILYANS